LQSNAHYEREQAFWDEKGAHDYATLSPADQQRIVGWIDWKGHGRVLDIGGGSGMVSRMLVDEPETDVVCLDISHAMLTHAPVPAVQADATRLPFASESFDLVVAAAFMHHLPDLYLRVMDDASRVLRPGGRVVGYDPNGRCVQNRIFMGNGPLRLKSFSPEERPIVPAKMAQNMAAARLDRFEFQYFTFRNETHTFAEKVQQRVLNPLARGPFEKYLDRWFFWRARKAPAAG
jgi:SAM-dependent methyltransferase